MRATWMTEKTPKIFKNCNGYSASNRKEEEIVRRKEKRNDVIDCWK